MDGEESRPGGRPTCFACCGRSPRHPNGACSQLRWPCVQASSRFRPHRIAVLAAQGSSSSAGARERNGATAQSHHATQDFIQTPRLLQTWSFVRYLRPRADVPAGCISNALRSSALSNGCPARYALPCCMCHHQVDPCRPVDPCSVCRSRDRGAAQAARPIKSCTTAWQTMPSSDAPREAPTGGAATAATPSIVDHRVRSEAPRPWWDEACEVLRRSMPVPLPRLLAALRDSSGRHGVPFPRALTDAAEAPLWRGCALPNAPALPARSPKHASMRLPLACGSASHIFASISKRSSRDEH